MRLVTVLIKGRQIAAVEVAGGRVALRTLMGESAPASVAHALPDLEALRDVLSRWKGMPDGALSAAPLLPPVPRPATFRDFYAFEQHVATCRARRGLGMEPGWYSQPVFYFSNPTALVGDGASVYAPAGCVELDYELELGVIISRPGRDIPAAEAWDFVAGFTVVNDLSARDLQRKEVPVGLGPAKAKDFATAVGPALVTLDGVRDRISPDGKIDLAMVARVNGRELSRGNAGDMHFSWPQIIEQASRDAELLPGDLIGSGTVGTGCILELGPENTGGWLKPGDQVELEIEHVGVLTTHIVVRPVTAKPNSS